MSAIFWTITQHYTGIAQIFMSVFVQSIRIGQLTNGAVNLLTASLKLLQQYPEVGVTPIL